MGFKDYKKTLSLRTRLRIKWLVLRDKLLQPFYKHVYCPHSATVTQLGETKMGYIYCLLCHKHILGEDK